MNGPMTFWTNTVERMRINESGDIGIGTTTPTAALRIGNFANGAPSNQIIIPGSYNFEQIRFDQIGRGNSQLEFACHTGTSNSYGIKMLVDVDHGAPGLQIQYAPSNVSYASLCYTTGLNLNLSGNVGIGTITPDAKLTVNGTVHSKAVVVDNSIFPDYVFKNIRPAPSIGSKNLYRLKPPLARNAIGSRGRQKRPEPGRSKRAAFDKGGGTYTVYDRNRKTGKSP